MTKRPKDRYDDVDWSLPTCEIALQVGVTPTSVSAARKRMAPDTVGRKGKPMPSSRWYGVDLTRPTGEIAKELGVCPSAVSNAKKRFSQNAKASR